MNNIYTDNLILGSGISGLMTALVLAQNGIESLILNKEDDLLESNTKYAQGGIAIKGKDDTYEEFVKDIDSAGVFWGSKEVIERVVKLGTDYTHKYLIDLLNVPFEKDNQGNLLYTKEAAHTNRRILFHKDFTGYAIEKSLVDFVNGSKLIKYKTSTTAINIITNTYNSLDPSQKYKETKVLGVYALDNNTNEVYKIFCNNLIIATGGVGNIFTYTSNPKGANGDGIVMAHQVGCEIINAEYVQFHPTILFNRKLKRFLISEALRGEGAKLVNSKGQKFMNRYHALEELAPRDEVSRAIYNEYDISGDIFLDTKGMKVDLKNRFESIYNKCLSVGIDITKDLIPVVPGAHYFCGGIKVSLDAKTNISNLYAVGETACNGIHGANRLASVSLLEAMTYGVLCANDIVKNSNQNNKDIFDTIPDWVYPKTEESFDKTLIKADFVTIKNTMWEYVGIVRSRDRLSRAVSDLNYMEHRVERFYKNSVLTKSIIELRNAVKMASIIANSAKRNTVSKGCHYRIN